MSQLTDSTGRPIGYIPFELQTGETSPAVQVFATAGADAIFKSGTSTIFELQARRAGTADPYEPLDAGIDLSGDPAGPVEFDLTATGLAVSGVEIDSIFVGVTGAGQAGWDV